MANATVCEIISIAARFVEGRMEKRFVVGVSRIDRIQSYARK